MNDEIELVGSFADEENCAGAIRALKRARLEPVRVFAPIPSEHIAEAVGARKSPVRAFVLTGGIVGIITGFALTIGTSMEWNLIVGGKPVISIPPFVIIAFELMILFGGISAVLSFLFNARLPALEPTAGYSERFGSDRFGVMVRCAQADGARIESLLRTAGAEEVVHEGAPEQATTYVEGPDKQ
jgi:Alternative complex III, ActD subunit